MKTLYIATASAAMLLLAASCSETYDILSEEYAEVVRIKDGGMKKTVVYSILDEMNYPITIMKGGHSPETTCNATLRIMSQDEFDTYLSESGAGYSYLPTDCYSFGASGSSVDVTFDSKQGYKETALTLYPEKIGKFYETYTDTSRDPVIPIVLESSDGSIDPYSHELFINPTYSEPVIGFTGNAVIELPEGSDIANLRIGMPMESPWDINCKIEVDPTVLDEWNAANNETYGLMPAGAYSDVSEVALNKGDEYAPVNIELDTDKAGFRTALPLRITQTDMDGLVLNNHTALVIYKGDYTKFKVNLTAADAYSPDDANDECLNDVGNRGTDGVGVAGLFDGIYAWSDGYFHACYFKGHHFDEKFNSYIELDLKSPRNMVVFEYTNRIYYTSVPTKIRIWALDGNEWKSIGESNTEHIFVTYWGNWDINKWPVGAYVAPFKFTKVRFSVVRGTGNRDFAGTAPNSNYFGTWACSELGVYAK